MLTTKITSTDEIITSESTATSVIDVAGMSVKISAEQDTVRATADALRKLLEQSATELDDDIDSPSDSSEIAISAIGEIEWMLPFSYDVISLVIDVAGAERIEYTTGSSVTDGLEDVLRGSVIDVAGVDAIKSIECIGVKLGDVAREITGSEVFAMLVGQVDDVALRASDAVELVSELDIDDEDMLLAAAYKTGAIVSELDIPTVLAACMKKRYMEDDANLD